MKILRFAITAFLLISPLAARAIPVTWTLVDVTFHDGGIATGSYVFDADTTTYSNINIATSGGASGAPSRGVSVVSAVAPRPTRRRHGTRPRTADRAFGPSKAAICANAQKDAGKHSVSLRSSRRRFAKLFLKAAG